MTRTARVLAAAAIAAMTAVLPFGSAANADNGDDRPGCSNGEICLWYDNGTLYQKQFYDNANHSGNNFMYSSEASGEYYISSRPVQDNALNATNKDTECQVWVGNYLGNGNWDKVVVDNDWSLKYLGSVNNRNDRHQRC